MTPLVFPRDLRTALDSAPLIDLYPASGASPTSNGWFRYSIPGVENQTLQDSAELALLEAMAKATGRDITDTLRAATVPAGLTAFLKGRAYKHAWMEDERVYRWVRFSRQGTRKNPYKVDIAISPEMNEQFVVRSFIDSDAERLYRGTQNILGPLLDSFVYESKLAAKNRL